MKSHILFDFDGTLVDSAPAILNCFERVLAAHDLKACRSIDSSLIGPPLRQTLELLSGKNEPEVLDALAASFKEIYDTEACLQTPAYPDCHQVLQQLLEQGFTLAIATNKRLLPTQRIIAALGWQDLFAKVFASDSAPERYGDKTGMIAALLEDFDIEPSAALYIGDTQGDGRASTANGVEFWPVAWGYGVFSEQEQPLLTMRELVKRVSSF